MAKADTNEYARIFRFMMRSGEKLFGVCSVSEIIQRNGKWLPVTLYQATARLQWQQLSIGEPEKKVLNLLRVNEQLEHELRQALWSSKLVSGWWAFKSFLRVVFLRPIVRTIYK